MDIDIPSASYFRTYIHPNTYNLQMIANPEISNQPCNTYISQIHPPILSKKAPPSQVLTSNTYPLTLTPFNYRRTHNGDYVYLDARVVRGRGKESVVGTGTFQDVKKLEWAGAGG